MKVQIIKPLAIIVMAAGLALPAWAQQQNRPPGPAQPGTINYVEGQVAIGTNQLSDSSVGKVTLGAGETLTTQDGRAEVLLLPGIFVRLNHDSALKMVSPDLANTEIALERGIAIVEVAQIQKANNVRVDVAGSSTRIEKTGLYQFNAEAKQIMVYKGKAQVHSGDHKITLTEDREVTLNNPKPKAHDFDEKQYETSDFYRWSALRSGYLSEANVDEARIYINGPGWSGPGWYWNPWFNAYTWIPGAGIRYSPFGWGYYSPYYLYNTPLLYGGYYERPHRFRDFHYPYGHGFVPQRPGGIFHQGSRGGIFHRGGRGGFHGPARPKGPRR